MPCSEWDGQDLVLEVIFDVLPGSPALSWLQSGPGEPHRCFCITEAGPGWARALLPCVDNPAELSSFTATFLVSGGLTVIMAAQLAKSDSSEELVDELVEDRIFKFVSDQPSPTDALCFAIGELSSLSSPSLRLWGEPQQLEAAVKELDCARTARSFEVLSSIFGPSWQAEHSASGALLQVLLVPPTCIHDGGRGHPGLLLIPPGALSGSMSYTISSWLVQAWLGVSKSTSWRDRWLSCGLELYVLHRFIQEMDGASAASLQVSVRRKAFLRALSALPPESPVARLRCEGDQWRQRVGELKVLEENGFAMMLWLREQCGDSTAAFDSFLGTCAIPALRRKCLTSEEFRDLLLATFPRCPDFLLSDLQASCPFDMSEPWLPELESCDERSVVDKVLKAWERIPPCEVVGSSQAQVSNLIIRTAVLVKMKWNVHQILYFLDSLLETTGVYRESIIRMGDAYGFNLAKNDDVLARWCQLLIQHNCQDHVAVIKSLLLRQGELKYVTATFRALVQKGRSDVRWKFISHELWELVQPSLHPVVQAEAFRILDRGKCIGSF
ncbi:unnamed protein product [Polarella glacialis]|uniref:Peptidase M1 leukotriene A4 hydrolase/aminopeptidase C-terminal domain-containing protein n=1 Tax=Polarella glacialis TaxID=89957 RepID=A0A813KZT0_POLGL|nr:unnamed protein product [Polarella glacialis]